MINVLPDMLVHWRLCMRGSQAWLSADFGFHLVVLVPPEVCDNISHLTGNNVLSFHFIKKECLSLIQTCTKQMIN